MPRDNESPQDGLPIPMRENLESQLHARIVTYESGGHVLPGGMCGCCGGGPDASRIGEVNRGISTVLGSAMRTASITGELDRLQRLRQTKHGWWESPLPDELITPIFP